MARVFPRSLCCGVNGGSYLVHRMYGYTALGRPQIAIVSRGRPLRSDECGVINFWGIVVPRILLNSVACSYVMTRNGSITTFEMKVFVLIPWR